jgi:dimeric dUTPase (all-alpha-NTP-PPase superfamily)
MNLQKLFEMQRVLDERIEKEHPRQKGEDRLAKKILALQVELGELANCWRGFKYWSHDQAPRTEVFRPLGDIGGRYITSGNYINPLLEEYVDCLHFILSIGLELNETDIEIDSDYTHENPSITFIHLFGDAWELSESCLDRWEKKEVYEMMFNRFIGLGEKHLGFTWEQIEEEYYRKNQINHKRQSEGY